MKQIKAGLLPLYIKLYDDFSSGMRTEIDRFHHAISDALRAKGLDIVDVPVCRIKEEFEAAIAKFEAEDCDCMITLNLAYSPSLEASDAIAKTYLPVIVLDTTPDYVYNQKSDPEILDYNHGIHGVQDLCNLMRRNGKGYVICAGHYEKSDVLDRVVKATKGALIAKTMKTAKGGVVGGQFYGMGDFAIAFDKIKETIGMEVVEYTADDVTEINDEELEEEYQADIAAYEVEGVSRELYYEVARDALSVRHWIEREGITGYTMNFLGCSKDGFFKKMPFAEASKSMAAGIGYAGEGDVLTSVLVGSLLKVYPNTSFCEMFCPDWSADTVFLNHMGEFNIRCSTGKCVLAHKNFRYTDSGETYSIRGRFMPGKSLFVCLAPQPNDRYALIICKGKMLEIEGENTMDCMINGWFKPNRPIADFLEEYSRNGGIHHAAMVWGGKVSVLREFAAYMGWDCVVIK